MKTWLGFVKGDVPAVSNKEKTLELPLKPCLRGIMEREQDVYAVESESTRSTDYSVYLNSL